MLAFEWGVAQAAAESTARSIVIASAVCLIGAPILFVGRLPFLCKASPALLATGGFFLLNIPCWYAFRSGYGVKAIYIALLMTGTLAGSLFMWRAWGVCKRLHNECAAVVVSFSLAVVIYSVLAFVRIKPGMLPWLDNGNGDLLAYLKCANVLLHEPVVTTAVSIIDLRNFMFEDVFGAFNLIAFSAFILGTSVELVPIPAMGAMIGLIAAAITIFCRRVFYLPTWISVFIPLIFTTSSMTSYVILSYFFGQIIFIGVMLPTLVVLAQVAERPSENSFSVALYLGIASTSILFCYNPWFEQFIILESIVFTITFTNFDWGEKLKSFARLFVGIGICFIGLNLFNFVLAPTRFFYGLSKLVFTASAASATTGWPLPFVDLGLLISLPVNWQDFPAPRPILSQILPALYIIVAIMIGVFCLDHGPGARGRKTVLWCFVTSVALYSCVWLVFGVSYRQWKFASTLTAPLGFSITAALVFLANKVAQRPARHAALACVSALIAASIFGGTKEYLLRWSANIFAFPKGLTEVSRADDDPSVEAVLIDTPPVIMSMGAAVFVNHKPIIFGGPTNYGPAYDYDKAAASEKTVAVFRRPCNNSAGSSFTLQNVALSEAASPVLPFGKEIKFNDTETSCVALQGFGGAEAWGRWTNGFSADIAFRCQCDLSKASVKVVLDAGSLIYPGIRDQQLIVFRINGVEHRVVFTTNDRRRIELPVPVDSKNNASVKVHIDLPDAVSPKMAGSPDPRVLGLSVKSLTIIRDPAK